jgi:hypothetical protein
MGWLRNFRSGKFHAYGQHTVKPENLRQARFPTVPLIQATDIAGFTARIHHYRYQYPVCVS